MIQLSVHFFPSAGSSNCVTKAKSKQIYATFILLTCRYYGDAGFGKQLTLLVFVCLILLLQPFMKGNLQMLVTAVLCGVVCIET